MGLRGLSMRACRTAVAAAAGLLLAVSAAYAQPRASFEARRDIPAPTGVSLADFGGLSGIDYDPTRKRYVVISDDTAQHGPSRFYEATIALRQARNGFSQPPDFAQPDPTIDRYLAC